MSFSNATCASFVAATCILTFIKTMDQEILRELSLLTVAAYKLSQTSIRFALQPTVFELQATFS